MKYDKEKLEAIIRDSSSYNDVSMKYHGYCNAKSTNQIRSFAFNNTIDTTHFDKSAKTRKYKVVEKVCPVCGTKFNTRKDHEKEKITCSHKCANTYFRSGEDNGNWSDDRYTTTCFAHHDKKCVICGEENIVAVHHYDGNHDNNKPENLVPMCPTHHQYMHSRFVVLIKEKVDSYVITWKSGRAV
jgi:hypothetical protein